MGEEDGHGAEGKLDMDMLLTSVEEAADLLGQPMLMHWPSLLVPHTVHTNLRKSLPAKSCVLTASRKSTSVFRTPTWLCTVHLQCLRTG